MGDEPNETEIGLARTFFEELLSAAGGAGLITLAARFADYAAEIRAEYGATPEQVKALVAVAKEYLDTSACFVKLGECPNRENRYIVPESCGECDGLGKLVTALALWKE